MGDSDWNLDWLGLDGQDLMCVHPVAAAETLNRAINHMTVAEVAVSVLRHGLNIPTAERKNDVSRCADKERRISEILRPVHGQYTAKYVVLYPRVEMSRSSSARRDTSFFNLVLRYVVLHPRAEIHSFSVQSSICSGARVMRNRLERHQTRRHFLSGAAPWNAIIDERSELMSRGLFIFAFQQ